LLRGGPGHGSITGPSFSANVLCKDHPRTNSLYGSPGQKTDTADSGMARVVGCRLEKWVICRLTAKSRPGSDFPCSVKQQGRACQAVVRPRMAGAAAEEPEIDAGGYCANRNRPDVIWHLTRSVPTNGHTVNRMTCMAPPATGGC
jgi:hypothetical protein